MLMHIYKGYSWFCGSEDGIQTTNEKDVKCPECLKNKPVDILHHPLTAFFQAVAKEYDASKKKYGEWQDKDDEWQINAVRSEIYELQAAILKRDNGERELQELPQLANVAGKRWIELGRMMGNEL